VIVQRSLIRPALPSPERIAREEAAARTMLAGKTDEDTPAPAVWAARACAPLAREGEALARARGHFLRRAEALGYRRTGEPGLRVLADGAAPPVSRAGARWRVALPAGATLVCLASRSWVPAHMRPHARDTRVLGVAIGWLALDGREVALDSPALARGWHPPEAGWRWTDGAALLPLPRGVRLLAFEVAMVGDYWARP